MSGLNSGMPYFPMKKEEEERQQWVGLDIGRDAVKVSTRGRNFTFPSTWGSARELSVGHERDYRLHIGGLNYFVGDMALESTDIRRNDGADKITEDTFVLAVTALAAANVGSDCKIVTGLPIVSYRKQTRQEMRQLLLEGLLPVRDGERVLRTDVLPAYTALSQARGIVSMNDQPRQIKIGAVTPSVEGGGAFYSMLLNDDGVYVRRDLLDRRLVRLIDLGSREMNVVTFIRTTIDGEEVGGMYLDRESFCIKSVANSKTYGCNQMQEHGTSPEAFTQQVLADIARTLPSFDPRVDPVYLSGGGVYSLADHLRNFMPHCEIVQPFGFKDDDQSGPLFANAIGYRRLGAADDEQKRRSQASR